MTDLFEAIRWTNLLLAATLSLLWLSRLGGFTRAAWPSKVGRLTVFGWLVSTGYGTWEALAYMAVPGYRIPATTSVLLLSGYWMFVEWRDDRLHRLLPRELRALLRDSDPRVTAGR